MTGRADIRSRIDTVLFHKDVDTIRRDRGATWLSIEAATGVNRSTLSRMKDGICPCAASFLQLCTWAEFNPYDYLLDPGETEAPPQPVSPVFTRAQEKRIQEMIDASRPG